MSEEKNFVCTTCGMSVSNSLFCPACGSQIDDDSSTINSKSQNLEFELPFGIVHAPKIYEDSITLYGIDFAPSVIKK